MRTISRYNQKTDTTAQLYGTLSMCETPKTISHCNQKTNTPPQLYCTLSSTCVSKPKPFSHQNQKLTQIHSLRVGWRNLFSSCAVCCVSLPQGTVGYPAQPGLIHVVSESVSLWVSLWRENFWFLVEKGTSPTNLPQPDFFMPKLMTMASAGAICGK